MTLQPLEARNAEATFRWVSDPEIASNLGLRRVPSLAATQEWIAAARGSPDVAAFAIQLGDLHVGNIVLDQTDWHLAVARLSIYVGERKIRGTGVGRSAILLVLRHAFETMGLNKVWLTVHTRNLGAARLYSEVGFELEGVLRDEFPIGGERCSAFRMGLLKREFEARGKS